MEQVDGALEAFADPSFQMLLVQAQKTAASTERPEDYDLLSELLIDRFKRGQNRIVRAGISLAVDVVDKISDEALQGLTASHALTYFRPTSGDIHKGLDTLNDLFGKLLYSELPNGDDWLDHLDILDTVRLSSFGTLKKTKEFYSEILNGYVDVGIDKKSESYSKAVEILNNNNLPSDIIVEHALNSDYVRVIASNSKLINEIHLFQEVINDGNLIKMAVKLSEAQIKAINSIYDLYSQDGSLKANNINLFMTEWDKRPNLKTLREWWDAISTSFTITTVGKVLAHSNAQRCDKHLPPLE